MLCDVGHRAGDFYCVCISFHFREQCTSFPLPSHAQQHSLLPDALCGCGWCSGQSQPQMPFLRNHPCCFFETGTLLIWGTLSQQGLIARKPQRPACFPLLVLELQVHAIMLGLFCMGSGRVKLKSLQTQVLHWLSLFLSYIFLIIDILAD